MGVVAGFLFYHPRILFPYWGNRRLVLRNLITKGAELRRPPVFFSSRRQLFFWGKEVRGGKINYVPEFFKNRATVLAGDIA